MGLFSLGPALFAEFLDVFIDSLLAALVDFWVPSKCKENFDNDEVRSDYCQKNVVHEGWISL